MTQQLFFSIITVCRNEERYIDLTAASVVNQTYKNYEWLVLEGQSIDKTLKILQKYKKNMAYFRSKKDKGIYYAMNEAIEKAKGQYLIFMNGGDQFYKKDILKKAHQFITNDDHKHKIYFGTAMTHDDNINDITISPKTKKYKIGRGVKKGYFFYDTLHHQSTFINKELFTKYGNYDTHYPYAADWEWFHRVSREKNIYIDMVVSIFNMSNWYSRVNDPKINAIQSRERTNLTYKNNSVFRIFLSLFKNLFSMLWGSYLIFLRDFRVAIQKIYLYKCTFLHKPWQLLKKILKK